MQPREECFFGDERVEEGIKVCFWMQSDNLVAIQITGVETKKEYALFEIDTKQIPYLTGWLNQVTSPVNTQLPEGMNPKTKSDAQR